MQPPYNILPVQAVGYLGFHKNRAKISPTTNAYTKGRGPNHVFQFFSYSRRQQVTCFRPYPSKVTLTTISLPSNAEDTKLVIGWKLLSLGRPNPKKSTLSGKWRHASFENVKKNFFGQRSHGPIPPNTPLRTRLRFSKTTSHEFPAVSKQGYTDHYLVAIAILRRQSLWLAENYYH